MRRRHDQVFIIMLVILDLTILIVYTFIITEEMDSTFAGHADGSQSSQVRLPRISTSKKNHRKTPHLTIQGSTRLVDFESPALASTLLFRSLPSGLYCSAGSASLYPNSSVRISASKIEQVSLIVTVVVLSCFLFELTMRQVAKGWRFVKDKWNIFDFVVRRLSMVIPRLGRSPDPEVHIFDLPCGTFLSMAVFPAFLIL
jgi:hypothetical protein